MSLKRRSLPYLALLLFIYIFLASCTPPAEIIVACDVSDLIDAINDANADSDTTKLILDPNCTYPFTAKDNDDGGQGPNGLPIVTTKIIIEGNNATLDRLSGPMFRYFFITDSGSLRLEDITIENGYALITTGVQPNTRGGAIYNDGGGLRAVRSIFRENIANQGEGGAIYSLGILTLEDTLFELNFSDFGAAIFNGGYMDIAVIIQDVTFDSNAAHDSGGAIYNASPEQGLLISGSTFVNNHSYFHGGAIFTESADLNISSSEFIDNLAGRSNTPDPDWGDGGAIYTQTGDIYIFGTYFDRQRANGVGGMLYAGPNSEVKLREVQGEESKACHGGGALYVEGTTEVLQTTLKDSSVGGWAGWNFGDISYFDECSGYHGGAIYNTGTLALDSSLLEENWVIDGDSDGIYNIGDLTTANSTFHYDINYNNAESRKQGVNNLGNAELSFTTFVYSSLVNSGSMTVKDIVVAGDNNGCYNSGTLTDIGENIAVDPACPFSIILPSFGDVVIQDFLSDNGGPTLTNFVGNVSPLIDKSDCLSASGSQVINDQRGIYRPHPLSGTHSCDVGALETYYESSPPPPPLPPTQMPEPSPSCDPFEDMDVSLILLNLPPDTRNLPVYLKVEKGIFPGFDPDGDLPNDYIARLGVFEAYQVSQEGFPERLYFMFHIPEGLEGTSQQFQVWLPDCPETVYELPAIQIPVPEPTDLVCTADLNAEDCKAAGGSYEQVGRTGKYECVCP
jgi:predicted outer membrane repeat protein